MGEAISTFMEVEGSVRVEQSSDDATSQEKGGSNCPCSMVGLSGSRTRQSSSEGQQAHVITRFWEDNRGLPQK